MILSRLSRKYPHGRGDRASGPGEETGPQDEEETKDPKLARAEGTEFLGVARSEALGGTRRRAPPTQEYRSPRHRLADGRNGTKGFTIVGFQEGREGPRRPTRRSGAHDAPGKPKGVRDPSQGE